MAQHLPDSAVCADRSQDPVASRSPERRHGVEAENYCAYNETSERLLGTDVDSGDFTVVSFHDRIPTLAANSGAGVRLVPFRGLPHITEQAPLDLIYLDANSIVIDVVCSFPSFNISKASPPAASVLVLPRHTIHSTETRRGDQLLFCTAAEFNRRRLRLRNPNNHTAIARSLDAGLFQPIGGGSGGRPQAPDLLANDRPNSAAFPVDLSEASQSHAAVWDDRKREDIKPLKNWLQRWWSLSAPERRKAQRESLPGLAAQFWTGGNPVEHGIRDISSTGLYVITDERWFVGTIVRMTLTDSGESAVRNSITANTSVVRWGNDGVGLSFIMNSEKDIRRGRTPDVSGVDKKALRRFLELARTSKRDRAAREAHLTDSPSDSKKAFSGDADRAFDDLFIGPISSSLLINSLKDLPRPVSVAASSAPINVSYAARQQSSGIVSAPVSGRRPRILLIDDDYLEVMFLVESLEQDYDVAFASDGLTALDSAGRNMPDLILLDVMMPGIDGFEVCRRLKAGNRTRQIPVIFITGLSEAAAEAKGLKLGAVDYISKPFHLAPLRESEYAYQAPNCRGAIDSLDCNHWSASVFELLGIEH